MDDDDALRVSEAEAGRVSFIIAAAGRGARREGEARAESKREEGEGRSGGEAERAEEAAGGG